MKAKQITQYCANIQIGALFLPYNQHIKFTDRCEQQWTGQSDPIIRLEDESSIRLQMYFPHFLSMGSTPLQEWYKPSLNVTNDG